MSKRIFIKDWASVSPLGEEKNEIWNNYLRGKPLFTSLQFNEVEYPCGQISMSIHEKINTIKQDKRFRNLDPTALIPIYCAQKLDTKNLSPNCGINIGSSRGATQVWEACYKAFQSSQKVPVPTSPTTTLGNISSWVAQTLQTQGPTFSHSITCSTALHGLANAMAWLQSGMANEFIVGGSEAPLTDFTMAQLDALRIYATQNEYPVRAFDLEKSQNGMALGEGACLFHLDTQTENARAEILGIGLGLEPITHGTSVTETGEALQKSMQQALVGMNPDEIDMVITHSPGTIFGDKSEFNAIQAVFEENLPSLYNNKWLIGHTYGASGALSLEAALLMLENGKKLCLPWFESGDMDQKPEKIMVNAQGFGGNAVSVVVGKYS